MIPLVTPKERNQSRLWDSSDTISMKMAKKASRLWDSSEFYQKRFRSVNLDFRVDYFAMKEYDGKS